MPIQKHDLDRIKQAAADAIATTGAAAGIHRQHLQPIMAFTLDAIDKAAGDPTDPRPFGQGTKVRVTASGVNGEVVRSLENEGAVHTVVVRLRLDDDSQPEIPFSPQELEVVK